MSYYDRWDDRNREAKKQGERDALMFKILSDEAMCKACTETNPDADVTPSECYHTNMNEIGHCAFLDGARYIAQAQAREDARELLTKHIGELSDDRPVFALTPEEYEALTKLAQVAD